MLDNMQGAAAFYSGKGFTADYDVRKFINTLRRVAGRFDSARIDAHTCALFDVHLDIESALLSWLQVPSIAFALKSAGYGVWLKACANVVVELEPEFPLDPDHLNYGKGYYLHVGKAPRGEGWTKIQ